MKRVLIVKMSALGDLFISLPYVESIMEHHKGDEVWLMTSPGYQEVFSCFKNLNVVTLDRKYYFAQQSALSRTNWVRKKKFDVIYDLQGNRTSRRLVRFSGSNSRVGVSKSGVYDVVPGEVGQLHVSTVVKDVLCQAGVENVSDRFNSEYSADYVAKVSDWKKEHGLEDGKYVLFHAGCSPEWPTKQWPVEYYADLALKIKSKGYTCIWAGGPDDVANSEELSKITGINAVCKFSFIELLLLGRKAAFSVCNDSAPSHIFGISGNPVYTFFGPTNWKKSHPVGNREQVLSAGCECSPCFSKRCKNPDLMKCMKMLTPERVFSEIFSGTCKV